MASSDPAASAVVPPGDGGEEAEVHHQEPGVLGDAFAASKLLRNRVKQNGCISRWLNKPATGIPSVAAMGLNYVALEEMARWYCPTQPFPRMINIDLLRDEAWYSYAFT
jgi:hypothetical protein